MRQLLCLLLFIIPVYYALFPGATPDEGDIRHIYPLIYIGIGLDNHAHAIPYIFGWLENLDYPKDRTKLEFFVLGKEDATIHQVKWWIDNTKKFYKSVKFYEESDNWLETGLRNARSQKTSRCFLMSGDTVPTDYNMLRYIFNEGSHVAVIPLFTSIDGSTNIDDPPEKILDRTYARHEISSFGLPIGINLTNMDSSYLTFDKQNIAFYEGADDPSQVFMASAEKMGISVWVDNQVDYGIYVNGELDMEERRNTIRYHIADLIADSKKLPIISKTVRPWQPEATKHGVDKIYLINLKRRPERLERMMRIFEILGIEYEVIEATDGKKLNELDDKYKNYKIMDGYLDPITKRPMKNGEIGCFLSHYRIWEDVIDKKYDKVIVFEDDLRFSHDGLKRIRDVLEDLEASRKQWDLIYLGRKKQSNIEELWIAQHRHLSSVEYSYWTLGYMLSNSGAQKLLDAKPLENVVPVDEYLPIMFDKHPDKEWSSKYPTRNLDAYTLYPLVVSPQRYTNEQGYVSDTEDSQLIPNNKLDESSDREL